MAASAMAGPGAWSPASVPLGAALPWDAGLFALHAAGTLAGFAVLSTKHGLGVLRAAGDMEGEARAEGMTPAAMERMVRGSEGPRTMRILGETVHAITEQGARTMVLVARGLRLGVVVAETPLGWVVATFRDKRPQLVVPQVERCLDAIRR